MSGWLTWRTRSAKALKGSIEETLAKLQISHFDEDLLKQDHEWLRRQFPRDSRRILKEKFFLNAVWQLHEKIQVATTPEERPDFYNKRGVIRGMWYHMKSKIDHIPEFKGDQADRISDALVTLVEAGVLSYKDFNFRDKSEGDRVLGRDNPYVILVAEKDGFLTMMQDFHATYGCHVFTLGGTPAFLSTNYFVAELVRMNVDITREFVCISIVDFDPKGDLIMQTFVHQLQASGLKNLKPFRQYPRRCDPDYRLDLIRPENLPRGVRYADVQYNLPKSEQKRSWGKETGGPNGRGDYKHGIESDEFREAHIRQLVEEAIAPHLTVGAEVVQKRVRMRALAVALKDFAAQKMIHGGLTRRRWS
ncbi:MAG: hypothetical protein AB1646_25150 [Thermodesulfobacteriota bacterium]